MYDPSDDTWLLVDAVRVGPGETFLEIGCGAGLASIQAARDGARVLATDINPQALQLTRSNARRNHVRLAVARCDLLAGIRGGPFDAVAFNPPYLPTTTEDHVPGALDAALSGGATGRDVLERFLDELQLRSVPRAWVVATSLQEPPSFEQLAKARGFRVRILSSKRLSFESLTVYDLFAR